MDFLSYRVAYRCAQIHMKPICSPRGIIGCESLGKKVWPDECMAVQPFTGGEWASASFLAEISIRSPRKLCALIIFVKKNRIKVSKKYFIYFGKQKHWNGHMMTLRPASRLAGQPMVSHEEPSK